ncbi:NAD(P)H-binding protein [Lewinella sp. IMCC34183]|uniref:NmrA family NAD(P)-binding protein n=1 Tax=Lewinella sp. IMCC34183 TaxID=2248762 RepID=UPI000E2256A7|nr:NAD(P)H-binding protein [Lewinella sp. IMCC34183]
MIIITGATGQLGHQVIAALRQHLPANQLVASVRDTHKAAAQLNDGIEVRAGDFTRPRDLETAFAGASQVLIVSVDKVGNTATEMHHAAIRAARAAGAERILYTSHQGARLDSPFAAAHDHAVTEQFLAAGPAAYTALRHGFYAESALHMVGSGLRNGELRVPEDGPISWTARADLAAADAAILATPGRIDGISPPLTGREMYTMSDLVRLASEESGRDIRHVTVTDAEWLAATEASGVPKVYAEMLLGTFLAARRGDFAVVDPTLENLIGRPPRGMRDILGEFLRTAKATDIAE